MDKWEKLKKEIEKRKSEQGSDFEFPKRGYLMSAEDRAALSAIQSRAMTAWWGALSESQRKEIGRRISEGHARNKATF